MKVFSRLMALLAVVGLVSMTSTASANVWLDENFEDATPLEQSDGNGNPARGWDTYSNDPLGANVTNTTGYAAQGQRVTTKAFEGSGSYELGTGESIIVGPNYDNPENGNFQVFQFAVNVAEPFPSASTEVATFSWNHDTDSTTAPDVDLPLFVQLVSNGSAIDLIAGRGNPATPDESGNIGSLTSGSEWDYITVMVQKENDDTSNPIFPSLGAVPQGAYFFNTSTTATLTVAYPGTEVNYVARDWSFDVSNGTVFLDDMYWDGGMESDDANANARALDKQQAPASVEDWMSHQ